MNKSLAIFFLCTLLYSIVESSAVTLNKNAYREVVIAINPEIAEDPILITSIQNAWIEASSALYTATKRRAYFGEITVVIPKHWTGNYGQSQARNENYETADILIAHASPVYQDQPYTIQYGDCAQSGTYIHLTPNYLMNSSVSDLFGPKGKTLVHEWAHYRWGVFDEYFTNGYSPFYFNSHGEVEATKCPSSLAGEFKIIDYSSGTSRDCNKNWENGLMEDGCQFVPYTEQASDINTSLMSNQYLPQIETFCHDDLNDPKNQHNKEAPNEQNRLCKLKSTWQVIMESPDFATNNNLPGSSNQDTTPVFKISQPQATNRFVLVLDVSGSMGDDNKLEQMRQVVSIFISQYAFGYQVAMVSFDTKAKIISDLVTVNGQNEVDILLSKIPKKAEGGTCIGCGLTKALEVFEKKGGDPAGGNIILLTDGEETDRPWVREVADEVIESGALVHAVFFATSANNDLQDLVESTNGIWFFGSDTDIISILGAFQSLSQTQDGDVYNEVFQVHSESFSVDKYSTYTGEVIIDSTVGNSTVFTFTWSQYDISIAVVLEHPSGCTYSTNPTVVQESCLGHPLAHIDNVFNIVTFALPGTTDTGRWRYYASTASALSQEMTATVTSRASNANTPPIKVASGLDKVEAGTSEAMVVYAQVSQGFVPVLGANVLAKIGRPDGTVVEVMLFDGGAAPDIRVNDGIYSRYFTEYNSQGRYSVQVIVSQTSSVTKILTAKSRANVNFATIGANGDVLINADAEKYEELPQTGAKVDDFERVLTAEGFSYTGNVNNRDNFPPSQVIDLFAQQVDVKDFSKGISLSFTAPGDDYDVGTAAEYDIRYVVNNISRLVDEFQLCDVIGTNETVGNVTKPKQAGSAESIVVSLDLTGNINEVKLAFALRSTDDSGNSATTSNVAPITFLLTPPGGAASTIMLSKPFVFVIGAVLYILIRS